ncbi:MULTISPECIES: hypothetical protein [unclassified Sphingobacterium]|uniref:hypothetical protein n=1 Tax=unclassified Sphingobacterium TaxID=2609468 RepID=UPI0025EE1238|nr:MULTISPECIES: hypothetical protein [unclassified Sphingobacterium]
MEPMTQDEKHQMSKMQEKLDLVDDKLDDVLNVLKGDEFGNSDGLVSEVKDLKKRVRTLEDLRSKILWIATGAGLAGGIVLDKVISFFKALFISVIIICLFNSCGMFRKSSRVTDIKKGVEISKSEQKINSEIKESMQQQEKEHETRQSESSGRITADKITVHPDGSIEAEGNAKADLSKTDKSDRNADRNKTINTESNIREQSNAAKEIKNETIYKSSESKPDPVGGSVMWIAIAVSVIIVVWGIKNFL